MFNIFKYLVDVGEVLLTINILDRGIDKRELMWKDLKCGCCGNTVFIHLNNTDDKIRYYCKKCLCISEVEIPRGFKPCSLCDGIGVTKFSNYLNCLKCNGTGLTSWIDDIMKGNVKSETKKNSGYWRSRFFGKSSL